ncbi:TPA: hypothetical protein ACNZ7M_003748 [Enterobacter kobei]|uniref:hypothetical protein n=1 Tax=Enterobacter kobei TaxID=208224 RepID=UPI003B853494
MHNHLDFQNYTKMEYGHLIIPSPDEKYKALPDIYDRLCAVIYFASNIESKSNRAIMSDKAHSEAMVRAALCEWVAIEEYISITCPDYKGTWFNEYVHSNPILHMLKLLRNFNVHIDSSRLEIESIRVMLPFDKNNEYDLDKAYISNVSVDSLEKLHGARKYIPHLPKMVDIFNEQQREWGISELIIKCTLDNTVNLDVLL